MISFIGFILSCFFLLAGCTPKEDVVAQAGDIKITGAEYRRILNRKMQLLGKVVLPVQEKKAIVNELIDRKLLYREGIKLGIQTAEIELNAAEAKARNSFGDERAFIDALKREGLDREGFRKDAAEGLVVRRVEEKLASGVAVSEADAQRYYEQHKSDYLIPPRYKIYLIQTKDGDDAIRLFRLLHRDAAEFDRQALNQGSVEQREINKKAALTPKSDFPEQMFPTLDKMRVGEIGGPIKAKNGYFLFRLIDRREGSRKSWNEVKGEVSHLLFEESRQKAVDNWLAQQKSGLKIEILPGKL